MNSLDLNLIQRKLDFVQILSIMDILVASSITQFQESITISYDQIIDMGIAIAEPIIIHSSKSESELIINGVSGL